MHGTWQTTGGGDGDGWKALAALGAIVLIGCSGAAGAVTGAIITIAITLGVVLLVVVAAMAWWLLRVRPVRDARAAEVRAAQVLAYEESKRQRALERERARAAIQAEANAGIAVAVVAALAQAQQQPQPQWMTARPVPVVRGEVER